VIRLATPQSRLDQIPEGLSLYHLLRDHIESRRKLTGRTIDGLQAASELDDARGIVGAHYHNDLLPCGCSSCVEANADANADEAPLDRPAHYHSAACLVPCGLVAGETEPVHEWADAAEFGSKVHADNEC